MIVYRPRFVRCLAIAISLACLTLRAQTNNSYPMLMCAKPTAIQIGQTTEVEINARYNLAGASQVIVYGSGVTGEVVPDEKEKPEDRTRNDIMASKCKVRFTVAADVVPGVRDFRIMTPHGVSTTGQVVVGRDPVVAESADNDTLATAQEVTLPATLCGAIEKAEDLDYFKFTVEPGAALTFHVRSQRLMNRLHDMQTRIDPMITLKSDSGATLAASDNYYAGDPLLHFRFERAGTYYLEVRDVRYQGNADWTYSIEVNGRPFVTQVKPLAVQINQETQLSLIGYNVPVGATVNCNRSAASLYGLDWLSLPVGGVPANEFAVHATELPVVRELVASPAPVVAADGTSPAVSTTTPFAVPSVLVGSLDNSGELDRFEFEAKGQERFSFEVIARRAWSGLDPVIRILNEQGGVLAETDDGTFDRVQSADSLLENWTAPADGKYRVEIRDLHQRGGPEFPYAIRVTRAEPYFQLEADTDKTLLAPGMSSVVYVRALRKNGFAGEIQLGVDGLPPGVTAVNGRVLADLGDGCILLQAAPDAPMGTVNVRIFGTATATNSAGNPVSLQANASILQEYYSPGGGRGNYPVDMHTVSVANPMDIRGVTVSKSDIQLKPGTSQKIEVTVQRAPDYAGNVTLDVILQHLEQPYGNTLPKGVKVDVAASKTLLTAGENVGFITLVAAPDAAAVEKQLVPLNVHVSINFVMKHTLCGPPLMVSVVK